MKSTLWQTKNRGNLSRSGMRIDGMRLLEKTGGKSGAWQAEA